jgi:hypothetical protein
VTATAKRKSGFFIGVGCPGCGGELELDADFFVIGCRHCGSPLRVIMPAIPAAFMIPSKVKSHEIRCHIDRYLKSESLPLTGSTLHTKSLYYPYWRVEATVLKLRNKTETRKVYCETDSTVENVIETDRSTVTVSPYHLTVAAGAHTEGIPDSLGLRSETVRAVPFSDDNIEPDFEPMPVIRSWESVNQRVRSAVAALSQINPADFGTNLSKLFNPVYTLVFFPYFLVEGYSSAYRRFVVDGLVGRVHKMITLGDESDDVQDRPDGRTEGATGDAFSRGRADGIYESESEGRDSGESAPESKFGSLDVDFHRCAVCGADLPTVVSHVYICSNCHEVQIPDPRSRCLTRLEAVDYESDREVQMVPFWRLKLPEIMSGQFGNLLGGLDKSDNLLVPAFGSENFEAVHKAARRLTVAYGRMETGTVEALDDRYLPVRIGPDEARALAEMIVSRELVDRGHRLPEDLNLQPLDYGLVYVPFHRENYFYIDSALNAVTLERVLID